VADDARIGDDATLLPEATPVLGDEPTAASMHARRSASASAVARVARYVLLDRLGEGGMGVVWSAYDPELDRRIAIKVLREPAAAGTPRRTRMLREAQALARLAHPNVVAIHDVGTLDERVWIAMEYVEGETLAAWRKRTNPSWREVVEVMSAAGRGLAAAHAVGLVHRDVKPDNVMVGRDGRVRVMDFGLAFAAAGGDASDAASDSTPLPIASQAQTLAGGLAGTPGYMPPEQLHHLEVDAAGDQFAYCVTLWEACYGTKAFLGATIVELSTAVLQGRIATPPADSRVPRWLRDVALRGMATDRAQRFASMTDLLDALDQGQLRARRRIAYAAATVVAIGGAVAWASHAAVERTRATACANEGAAIAEVWPGAGDTQRTAVAAAITRTGVPFAASTLERIDARLDEYTAKWSAARGAACLRDQSDPLRDQIVACLDDQREMMTATISVFREADRDVATGAISSTASLVPVYDCEDAAYLARIENEVVGSEGAAGELRRRLTRLTATVRTGNDDGVIADAAALVADADAIGATALVAQAHALHGETLMRASKFEDAVEAMRAGFTMALGIGRDHVALDAAANLAFAIGYRLGRNAEGRQWIAIADAMLRRLPSDDGSCEGLIRHNEAILFALGGDMDSAVQSLERALELTIPVNGPDHLSIARIHTDLGAVHTEARQLAPALMHHRRALEIYEAALGPDHPMIASTLINLGAAHQFLGSNELARAAFERAIAVAESVDGSEHANVASALESLGTTFTLLGEHERAFAALQRSLVIRTAVLPPEHPEVMDSLERLAEAEIELGRLDAALAHIDTARTSLEAQPEPDPTRTSWWSVLRGRIHLERGALAEANAVLEPAIAGGKLMGGRLAYGQLALAETLRRSGGDMVRARALVRAAKIGLAEPGVADTALIAEVDAWLTAHG